MLHSEVDLLTSWQNRKWVCLSGSDVGCCELFKSTFGRFTYDICVHLPVLNMLQML